MYDSGVAPVRGLSSRTSDDRVGLRTESLTLVPVDCLAHLVEYFGGGTMGQPIETRRCEQGIAKERGPLGRGSIAGQHDAALFIAFVDDIVEVFGSRCSQRFEAEVIQDEQGWTQNTLQTPFQGVIGAAAGAAGPAPRCRHR